MDTGNKTLTPGFILLGFYELPHQQSSLFVIFLLVYLIALVGNLFIAVVICFSSKLHTPMYYFLCNIAILDIILTSTAMPKLLQICLTGDQFITYLGCFSQALFFVICVVTEPSLFMFMAYDRYVAICYPLRYNYFMSMKICFILALTSWGFGILTSLPFTVLVSRCTFIKYNTIDRFFCDLESPMKLSASSTQEIQMGVLVCTFIFGCIPLVFILMTYIIIFYNILKIRSSEGKRKAFSTCSSHLIVISIFIIMVISMFIRPKPMYIIDVDKIIALLHTSCIPSLNPIIYSFRNKDVHVAIQKLMPSICW